MFPMGELEPGKNKSGLTARTGACKPVAIMASREQPRDAFAQKTGDKLP